MDGKDRDYLQRDSASLSYATFRPATRDNCARWMELVSSGMTPPSLPKSAHPVCNTGACGK